MADDLSLERVAALAGHRAKPERTPGRLRQDEYGALVTEDGRKLELSRVALRAGYGGPGDPAPANDRFVLAAWNAAHDAGLSTEALEAGVVADLLAALEDALPYVEGAYECAFPDEIENENVAHRARAALAKARGT